MKADLNLTLKNVVDQIREQHLPSSIVLSFIPYREPVETLPCSPDEIVRIVSLLVHYSIQGLRKNGEVVEVKIEDVGESLSILVSDSGEGLRADSGLFDLFHRSGLKPLRDLDTIDSNLKMAHEFSQRVRAKIWVESKWGAGTSFHFEIPFAESQRSSTKK